MKVSVAIVTYNRLEKLKKALAAYETQLDYIHSIVVVNNNSTDDTEKYLEDWRVSGDVKKKYVVNLDNNIGGSGGFYTGEEYLLKQEPDWIFVADDDAYPDKDLFKKFSHFVQDNSVDKIGAICAQVINADHSIAYHHRGRVNVKYSIKFDVTPSSEVDYKDIFGIDVFSYVGTFLNVCALNTVGCCVRDLFIYADDKEHSLRIRKWGEIICVPQFKILHDCGEMMQKKDGSLMSWRHYYLVRNNIFLLKKHYPFAVLYSILGYLKYAFKMKKFDCIKLTIAAIFDGLFSRLGKHVLYKPNYVIKKES